MIAPLFFRLHFFPHQCCYLFLLIVVFTANTLGEGEGWGGGRRGKIGWEEVYIPDHGNLLFVLKLGICILIKALHLILVNTSKK